MKPETDIAPKIREALHTHGNLTSVEIAAVLDPDGSRPNKPVQNSLLSMRKRGAVSCVGRRAGLLLYALTSRGRRMVRVWAKYV